MASPSHSLKCITQQEIGSPSQTPFRPSNAGNFEDFNLEQDKQEEVPTREKMSQGGGKFGSQPKSSSVQQYPPVDENQDPTVEIDVRVGFRGSHRPPGHHRLEINAMENEAHLPSGNSHRNAPPVAMTPTFHNYSRQESDCPNQLIGSNQQPARNQEVNSALLEHKSKHSYNAPGNSNAIQGTPQAWDEQSHRDHIMLCRSHEFAGASLGPYDRNSGRYDRYHVESKQNVPSSNMMRRSFSQFETARGCQPFQQGCQGESDKGQALLPPNRRKQINSRGDQITDKTKVENDLTAHLASNMGLGNSAVCANSNQELNNPPQMLLVSRLIFDSIILLISSEHSIHMKELMNMKVRIFVLNSLLLLTGALRHSIENVLCFNFSQRNLQYLSRSLQPKVRAVFSSTIQFHFNTLQNYERLFVPGSIP